MAKVWAFQKLATSSNTDGTRKNTIRNRKGGEANR
jgi:hypothetical protein